MARLKKIILLLMLAVALAKGWQLVTDGFRLDKITEELPPLSEETSAAALAALQQPFFYLDKGCQAYVFQSLDQKYVLKLVRYHKYRPPFWVHFLKWPAKADSYRQARLAHRQKSRRTSLRSYLIAGSALQAETAILHVHLGQTENLLPVKFCLIDRLGRKSYLDLNNVGFILQKKVIPLQQQLYALKKQDDREGLRAVFAKFLQSYTGICKKGFVIRDYNCVKNSGLAEGEVVGMDVGSFFPQKGLQQYDCYEEELRHFSKHFKKWLVKHYPACSACYEEEIQKALKAYEQEAL